MLERGKISALQMGLILHPTVIATGILFVPAISGTHAGRDLWMTPFVACLAGFYAFWVANTLHKMYPKQTVMEYAEAILGKGIGKLITAFLLFYYIDSLGIVVREYAEFIIGGFLPNTPLYIITGSMLFVSALAVYGGIEVIARATQVFMPTIVFFIVGVFVFLLPELEIKNMFPILEKGFGPVFKGSVSFIGWFGEFFLAAFLLPFVTDQENVKKWGNISVISVLVAMAMSNFIGLFLFGESVSKLMYPVLTAAKFINIADFIDHIEAVFAMIWVASIFMKISFFFYAAALSTAQWLKLSDYKSLVFPLAFLGVVWSVWTTPNISSFTHYLGTIAPYYLISVHIAIPTLLLIVAYIKKAFDKKKGVTIHG
ncbi:GerAB/ArcD/ProY family transporter [Bacillus kexueae]|uniref:GerAB/ArcD/ProY family transporter n=1 Tax=Aeribacillus kexueae TaxID=2078952 RepID=UPI001FAF2980|nr:endospore germination permease [Bacillus kexueae]